VVELASRLLGQDWEARFLDRISGGAIERVLL
jgi:hypothetical protein